jgi:hypothetical protein
MAGAGYKQWTTGAVLTSTDMNTYVGDQVVMVFASSSARSSAVSSPAEGMVSYLKDTNALEYYDGSAWTAVVSNTIEINAQTGTTYTFVLADAGKLVTSSNGSAQTLTVPPNSSVAFAIGSQIIVQNIGSANATLAQGSGVTIQSKDSNKEIDGQYAAATLIKTATDTWTLIGALK